MQLTLENSPEPYKIVAYGADFIQVNSEKIHQSFILLPNKLIVPWPPMRSNEITIEDCYVLIEIKPDLILLGTGTSLVFPSPSILDFFNKNVVPFDIMQTPAACRTYPILQSEKRKVAAAFLIN